MQTKKWKTLSDHPIPEPGRYLIRDHVFGWTHLFIVSRREEDGVLCAQANALWCQHEPFPLKDAARWLEWRTPDDLQPVDPRQLELPLHNAGGE